jgi:antagonist of KipI
MAIRVSNPGFVSTVQDLGRVGFSHLGISPAGAADRLSFRVSNKLVGNDENAAALEMTLLGATLEFEKSTVVAVVGANYKLDGHDVPQSQAFRVPSGSILMCSAMTTGARAYLAVQGGLDLPLVMGSASTDIAGKFGGFQGRPLRGGDVLQVRQNSGLQIRSLRSGVRIPTAKNSPTILRVTRGAQQDWFGSDAFDRLFSHTFVISEQSGRTGLRLKGPRIAPREHSELLTDGTPLGAIQIPQDGQPIILFVDQQTTGGYPKIANVIAADMHRVGQLKAQDEVKFSEVSIAEAIRFLREQEAWFEGLFVSDLT